MWHKKEERTPEAHREYLKNLEKVKTPEDARALHKEMKKYKRWIRTSTTNEIP